MKFLRSEQGAAIAGPVNVEAPATNVTEELWIVDAGHCTSKRNAFGTRTVVWVAHLPFA